MTSCQGQVKNIPEKENINQPQLPSNKTTNISPISVVALILFSL